MTDQQTEVRHFEDGYDADNDSYAGGYDSAALDDWESQEEWDSLDDWDAYVAAVRPTAPPQITRPWYRDPRWLFGLIALAAAALVVATVLLVTGRGSGEIPTSPQLTTRTPASTTSTATQRSASPRESASSSTTPTSAPSASEDPSALDVPPPVAPTASAIEAPAEPPTQSQNKSSAGPRINVTRTPMSFSPGKH